MLWHRHARHCCLRCALGIWNRYRTDHPLPRRAQRYVARNRGNKIRATQSVIRNGGGINSLGCAHSTRNVFRTCNQMLMPASLKAAVIHVLATGNAADRLIALLRFLRPITGGQMRAD